MGIIKHLSHRIVLWIKWVDSYNVLAHYQAYGKHSVNVNNCLYKWHHTVWILLKLISLPVILLRTCGSGSLVWTAAEHLSAFIPLPFVGTLAWFSQTNTVHFFVHASLPMVLKFLIYVPFHREDSLRESLIVQQAISPVLWLVTSNDGNNAILSGSSYYFGLRCQR